MVQMTGNFAVSTEQRIPPYVLIFCSFQSIRIEILKLFDSVLNMESEIVMIVV